MAMKIGEQEVNSQLRIIHLQAQANRMRNRRGTSTGGHFLGDRVVCGTTMGTGTSQQAAYLPLAFSAS